MRRNPPPDFPETFLPGVARAADAELAAVLAEDFAIRQALERTAPAIGRGPRPTR